MRRKKTWNEKVEQGRPHQVKRIDKNFADLKAGQRVLIPSAQLVRDRIQKIPRGTMMPAKELRRRLANEQGAEATCPVTFGIQLRTVAEAMYESLEQGAEPAELTPVWRVLDEGSPTIKKLSYDPEVLWSCRRAEGL